MFETVKQLLAEGLGIDEAQITREASFKDDLKADSLDLYDLVVTLEDETGVEIPTEELEKLTTVGALVDYIEAHKN